MGAANIMYKLTFNHIVDLRYILVIMIESEYTASLLIETWIFSLHYFDMLPDFVIFFFCTLINSELHLKTMLKKWVFSLSHAFVFLLMRNKQSGFIFNERRGDNGLVYIYNILMLKWKFSPGSVIVLFSSYSVMSVSILALNVPLIKIGKTTLAHNIYELHKMRQYSSTSREFLKAYLKKHTSTIIMSGWCSSCRFQLLLLINYLKFQVQQLTA